MSKKKDSRGYKDAGQLTEWLNIWGESKTLAYQQTVRLIELLKVVRQAPALPMPAERAEIESLLEPLSRGASWRLVPSFPPRGSRALAIGWHVTQAFPEELSGRFLATRLATDGLDWVRQCRCGKWFIGYSRGHRFCSPKCKEASESQERKTPEGREQRRLYMRSLRASKRRRNTREGTIQRKRGK
jgi:hypothetical protein